VHSEMEVNTLEFYAQDCAHLRQNRDHINLVIAQGRKALGEIQ
jgi:hypothetical protein